MGHCIFISIYMREPFLQRHFGITVLGLAGGVLVGWRFEDLHIPAGDCEIVLGMSALPPRPGACTPASSVFGRGNNLPGDHRIEQLYALPPLVVDGVPLSDLQGRWAGVLHLPVEIRVRPK